MLQHCLYHCLLCECSFDLLAQVGLAKALEEPVWAAAKTSEERTAAQVARRRRWTDGCLRQKFCFYIFEKMYTQYNIHISIDLSISISILLYSSLFGHTLNKFQCNSNAMPLGVSASRSFVMRRLELSLCLAGFDLVNDVGLRTRMVCLHHLEAASTLDSTTSLDLSGLAWQARQSPVFPFFFPYFPPYFRSFGKHVQIFNSRPSEPPDIL